MEFVEKIIENVLDGRDNQQRSEPSYGYSAAPPPPPGPPLPPPWVARWDERDQRWFYVNEQTGERSWDRPYSSYAEYGAGGGYSQPAAPLPQQQQQYYPQSEAYNAQAGYESRQEYYAEEGEMERREKKKHSHKLAYGAAGVAAGVVGGALLMHEGEKIRDDWDYDKERMEERVDEFPEEAAEWTGEKIGEIESVPERIENGWDRAEDRVENGFDDAVQGVEDIPEDVAGWAGRKVGEVERFGDEVDDAYEEGRYEGREDGW